MTSGGVERAKLKCHVPTDPDDHHREQEYGLGATDSNLDRTVVPGFLVYDIRVPYSVVAPGRTSSRVFAFKQFDELIRHRAGKLGGI